MLGKQWILRSIPFKSRGKIVDKGKGRQIKLTALQGWGLRLITGSPPFLLQFALLLFYAAVIVYLWDLNISIGAVILVVASVGLVFCIIVITMIRGDFPFRITFSALSSFAKRRTRSVHVWLRRGFAMHLPRIKRTIQQSGFLQRIFRNFIDVNAHTHHTTPCAFSKHYPMKLSNPGFWRQDPLFTSPVPKDVAASAGLRILENSSDLSDASVVAATFSEIQWPSHYYSMTALYRFRDTYTECFRTPELNKTTRLRALQSAAAYYVLYHTQLIWSISTNTESGMENISSLSPDLFLQHSEEWGGDDVFEYLLRIEDRSAPVTSARFLSYIAPYWFCGDSDVAIKFRPSRLQTLNELIDVLERNGALNPATATDCILCAGAVMDFPLHPEDLIRVDKRYVLFSPWVRSEAD